MEDDFDIKNFITELRKTQVAIKAEEHMKKYKAE